MKKPYRLAVPVFLSVFLLNHAQAADLSQKTNQLVNRMHAANREEIELSRLAVQHAKNVPVKDYAQHMASSHQEADEHLLAIVKQQGITLAPEPESDVHDTTEKMKQASGDDVDSTYIKAMTELHEKLLQQVRGAPDWLPAGGALAKFTQDQIPVLEHHLMLAKQIQTDLKEKKK